jgi:DNA-directed RNA polymerase specialized sigma24 family protein
MSDQVTPGLKDVVDSINDLTRVTVALHGNFESRADAVRRLSELSIPPARIASILAMPLNAVHSTLTKAKQRVQKLGGAKARAPISDSAVLEEQDG